MTEQDSNPVLSSSKATPLSLDPVQEGRARERLRARGAVERPSTPAAPALLQGEHSLWATAQGRGAVALPGKPGPSGGRPCPRASPCQPRLITAPCVLTEKLYLPLGIDVKINACLANYSFPSTSRSRESRSLGNGKWKQTSRSVSRLGRSTTSWAQLHRAWGLSKGG